MNKPRCIAILLLCSFLWISVFGAECPFKECECGETVIMCNDKGLKAMPQKTIKKNMYFTDVLFDRNSITNITGGSLPANLSQMSFLENPITTIEDDAFDGSADTLSVLTFSQARFARFPDAFLHLSALRTLYITNSTVQDWNEDAMKHIGVTVNYFLLEDIPLHTWPSWLQYFSNLTQLNVEGCAIADIPDDTFDILANTLTVLTLNNNILTIVPKAISKLTALQLLGLDKNKITDVKWLPQSSKLTALTLNGNKLHDSNQLSTFLRPFADTLNEFTLEGNLLTSFPTLDFLKHVDEMDFRNNKLVDPNSGSLPPALIDLKLGRNSLSRIPRFFSGLKSITQLFLGTNSITLLEGTAFPPLTTGVELQHNLLKEITDTSFPLNASITYILLNNNPLVSISDNAFKNLLHLVEIQLQYTKMTRLPLALSYLKNMDDLDISNTDTLVCTCLEKSLKEWILTLQENQVKGTCGQTSIYYFYNELSSDCP